MCVCVFADRCMGTPLIQLGTHGQLWGLWWARVWSGVFSWAFHSCLLRVSLWQIQSNHRITKQIVHQLDADCLLWVYVENADHHSGTSSVLSLIITKGICRLGNCRTLGQKSSRYCSWRVNHCRQYSGSRKVLFTLNLSKRHNHHSRFLFWHTCVRLWNAITKKRLKLLSKMVFFLHDITRPHTVRLTKFLLIEAGNINFAHSACSSDLQPDDFHLFPVRGW